MLNAKPPDQIKRKEELEFMSTKWDRRLANQSYHLTVRRTITAPAELLFDFWTQPEHVRAWWGPDHVQCSHVEIDLKIGGRYLIGNELPDGEIVWITGRFEVINRPTELVYTWHVNSDEEPPAERVHVRFEALDSETTEVIVTHELISSENIQKQHLRGWTGCMNGLAEFVLSQDM